MIQGALTSRCIYIKCSMPALKRTLSSPRVRVNFFDSVRSDDSLTNLQWTAPLSGSSERCPKGPRGERGTE